MRSAERFWRLLERHEAARQRGVATLTVIESTAGIPAIVDRFWWPERLVIAIEGESIVAEAVVSIAEAIDLRPRVAEVIALVLDRSPDEIATKLETLGEPELAALLSSYEDAERRRSIAPVVCELARGRTPAPELETLRALSRIITPAPVLYIDGARLEAAAEIASAAPALAVVVAASPDEIAAFLDRRDDRASALVHQGLIRVPAVAEIRKNRNDSAVEIARSRAVEAFRDLLWGSTEPDEARSAAEALLHARLEAGPPTAGHFRLNVPMSFRIGNRPAEIALYSKAHALAVEVDGYYHVTDRDAYRRDRRTDLLLQRHRIVVVRVLADDVVERLEEIVSDVIDVMRWREREGGAGR